jgi:hypothetical protein
MAMIPPVIPPTTTDIMLLETENGAATRVSCVVAVETSSMLACVVVSEDVGISDLVDVDDDDDDVTLACVVAAAGVDPVMPVGTVVVSVLACVVVSMARDVIEAQPDVTGSGIACVVTVAAVVGGRSRVVGTSGHESAFSSMHNKKLLSFY